LGWDISDVALEQVPHLKLISFTGIGAGKFINLDIARRRGITVTNTPGYADVTVAEHTLGLMLDLARHITRLDRNTRAGGWNKGIQGRDLSGQTLGLLGFGASARILDIAIDNLASFYAGQPQNVVT
jgi:lactate dehydrogenase-like 2-hydroxyacid dehydrogenase